MQNYNVTANETSANFTYRYFLSQIDHGMQGIGTNGESLHTLAYFRNSINNEIRRLNALLSDGMYPEYDTYKPVTTIHANSLSVYQYRVIESASKAWLEYRIKFINPSQLSSCDKAAIVATDRAIAFIKTLDPRKN